MKQHTPMRVGLYRKNRLFNCIPRMRNRLSEELISQGGIINDPSFHILDIGDKTDSKRIRSKFKKVDVKSTGSVGDSADLINDGSSVYDTVYLTQQLTLLEPGILNGVFRSIYESTRVGGTVVVTDYYITDNDYEIRKTKVEFRFHTGGEIHRLESIAKIAKMCGFSIVEFRDYSEEVRNFFHVHYKRTKNWQANWGRYNLTERAGFGSLILRKLP